MYVCVSVSVQEVICARMSDKHLRKKGKIDVNCVKNRKKIPLSSTRLPFEGESKERITKRERERKKKRELFILWQTRTILTDTSFYQIRIKMVL